MLQTLDLPDSPTPAPVADDLTFIGNATLLLRLNGIALLTDPNFLHAGDHAHLGYGLSSRRLTNPSIEFAALPPYDAVLLSHYHGDHFDWFVEREMRRDVPIVTTRHAAKKLTGKGFSATQQLRTWESLNLNKGARSLKITALPGRHGPAGLAKVLPPVMGSLLEFSRPGGAIFRLYISGDTLVFNALREIPRRYPHIDLALIHLGGTRVMGVLVTLDGEGGVTALRILQPRLAIPIHYEEYTVMKSPLSDFIAEVERAGMGDRVRYLARGETYTL